MTITPQNLIALLPLLIVGLTVVVVMLSIAWRRNHFLNATLSVIGLNAALVSLWFVGQAGAMDVTPQQGRVLPVGVNCRAGRDPAGECQPSGVSVPRYRTDLFAAVWPGRLRFPPETFTGSQYQIHHPFCRSVFFPAVWYGAGVCAVWRPVVCRVG